MGTQQEKGLVLNIVPVSFDTDKMVIGRMPNMSKDEYRQLRDAHWETHAFRYDSRHGEILNVPLGPDIDPLGKADEVNLQEYLLLIARAVQHDILVWLAKGLPILRSGKKLVFWGQADNALLLSRAAKKVGVKKTPGLEVALRYEIDCRMFRDSDDRLYLGLVIDVATSNIIEIPILELQKQGLKIDGRYVCRRHEPEKDYLRPRLELLGQVSGVEGARLLLTESEGVIKVEADGVLLEPRLEYLNDVIKLYYGSAATRLLSALDGFRKPISTATSKLARIRDTLAKLKKRPIVIANNVNVELGELLNLKDTRFPDKITTYRPTLLFGPQGRKHGSVPDKGITDHGPYMYMQHERNTPLLAVVCESRHRGRVEQFIRLLLDGFPDEMWHNQRRMNPFPEGLVSKFRLSKVRVEYEECKNPTAQAYKEAVNRLLRRLPSTPDLAIVQIRENFMQLYGNANPYLVSKAAFMMAGVPTQSVRIEKIDKPGGDIAYLLNTISLAIYAKLDGIPWVMSTPRPTTHELVVGLGTAEVSRGRLEARTRYVGITTVFQGDGRYLVWGTTREVEFENYAAALLETLRARVKHVQQHNAWQNGDKVRLVCHVYKRLRDCEVEAIKALVSELVADRFEVEFAFLDISWWHPYHIFDPSQKGENYWDREKRAYRVKGKGVPQRGLCLQLDKSRGLLQLTGPKDLKTREQGIPRPLLIELHRDSDFTDMTYLLRQIYHFAYMSWRSFLPGTEPVTIAYSRQIAKLLGNLKAVTGWNSQVLSVGSLRDRRWFL